MMFNHGFGWFSIWIPLLVLIGIVLIIINFRRDSGKDLDNESAKSIIAERYAKGEITEEEYERMRDVLRK